MKLCLNKLLKFKKTDAMDIFFFAKMVTYMMTQNQNMLLRASVVYTDSLNYPGMLDIVRSLGQTFLQLAVFFEGIRLLIH